MVCAMPKEWVHINAPVVVASVRVSLKFVWANFQKCSPVLLFPFYHFRGLFFTNTEHFPQQFPLTRTAAQMQVGVVLHRMWSWTKEKDWKGLKCGGMCVPALRYMLDLMWLVRVSLEHSSLWNVHAFSSAPAIKEGLSCCMSFLLLFI